LWQDDFLERITERLERRDWSRDLMLRGSMAFARHDAHSDIDLAVTVEDEDFEEAIKDCAGSLGSDLGFALPPWLDSLVRDFGGLGFVYLHEVESGHWGQTDIYILPLSARSRLLEHALVTWLRDGPREFGGRDLEGVAAVRRRWENASPRQLEQLVMRCYVTAFLLRKRIARGDLIQAFAESYFLAEGVRDLLVEACDPHRRDHGWHGIPDLLDRAPDRRLAEEVLLAFVHDRAANSLAGRVASLERLVESLAPTTWRARESALRSLGAYLAAPSTA
jgi:hypothetical protein